MEINSKVRHFYQLDSTNMYLKTHMIDFPDKTIVVADQQTNGRGQGSNKWLSSNSNNLYMSILIKGSSINVDLLSSLTQFMAVIAADTIDQVDQSLIYKTQVKWPNDLLIGGKKVGGILAESNFIGSKLIGVALGMGINFNLLDSEKTQINQPSTSLSDHFIKVPNKVIWFESFIQRFFDHFEEFKCLGKGMFEKELEKKLVKS